AADMPGEEVHTVAYQLAMEQLDASPDQLLLYYFWAEDFGPDGSERRVAGDLYFADVRAFEEQFRQGEQEPGGAENSRQQQQQQGAGGQMQQTEERIDLQKEIITATWNVQRRATLQNVQKGNVPEAT